MRNFEFNLEDNLFRLHSGLKEKTYRHSHYTPFNVCDPKLRRIHKAIVRDRVVHHAVFRALYPVFDKSFIFDSYSCRLKKGTHRAVKRLETFAKKISANGTKNIFALKCDVKKFFASIDHEILKNILAKRIEDKNVLWLLDRIIGSFSSPRSFATSPLLIRRGDGLPATLSLARRAGGGRGLRGEGKKICIVSFPPAAKQAGERPG